MNEFNAKEELSKVITFIRNYYDKNNITGAVIGISGGKDSAVVSAIMCEAIGCENVIGLTLPCHSKEEDMIDAKLISDYYKFKLVNIDLTKTFDSFKEEIGKLNIDKASLIDSDINLKPRLRMSTLYYMAALYKNLTGKTYLVVGTSNKSELYVGYFTKGGDSVYDISFLSSFTKEEVIKLGEVLNVPKKVLYKTPSDGLSNETDEDRLKVKYSDIEKYLNNPLSIEENIRKRIEKLHNNNLHKFNIPNYKR